MLAGVAYAAIQILLSMFYANVLIGLWQYNLDSRILAKSGCHHKKNEQQKAIEYQIFNEFLRKWAKLEQVSKVLLKKEHQDFNRYSIREIMYLLNKNNILNDSEINLFEEVIQIRNSMVHQGFKYPIKTIEKNESSKTLQQTK